MKSFKSTAWLMPQPVLIIGTYDKDGKPNAMNAAWGGQWDMHLYKRGFVWSEQQKQFRPIGFGNE